MLVDAANGLTLGWEAETEALRIPAYAAWKYAFVAVDLGEISWWLEGI